MFNIKPNDKVVVKNEHEDGTVKNLMIVCPNCSSLSCEKFKIGEGELWATVEFKLTYNSDFKSIQEYHKVDNLTLSTTHVDLDSILN